MQILMESAPDDINLDELTAELESITDIQEVHHLHVWELDETHRALEAHVVVDSARFDQWAGIKRNVKVRLNERFGISHSTIELECIGEQCEPCPPGII